MAASETDVTRMTPRLRRAATAYRRAIRLAHRHLPAQSEDEQVAVFEALQEDAYRNARWPGVFRLWLAEALSLMRLARKSSFDLRTSKFDLSAGSTMSILRCDLRDA